MLRPNFFPKFDRDDNLDGDHGYNDDHPNPDADHNQLTDEQLRHRATWKDIWLQAKNMKLWIDFAWIVGITDDKILSWSAIWITSQTHCILLSPK